MEKPFARQHNGMYYKKDTIMIASGYSAHPGKRGLRIASEQTETSIEVRQGQMEERRLPRAQTKHQMQRQMDGRHQCGCTEIVLLLK